MSLIDFEDARWGQVQGTRLCSNGNNTLDDQSLGVEFFIVDGSMKVLRSSGDRRLAFFRRDCRGTFHTRTTLVIRFDSPQQYVRFRFYPNAHQDFDVRFFGEHAETNLRDSRTVPVTFLQASEVVYSSTEPIKELTITSGSAENNFTELEFHEDFADIQHDVALALDGSGSMSAQDKWGSMVEAADVFHDLYSEFGDSTEGFGGVRFRWDCGDQLAGDETTSQPPLNPLSTGVDVPAVYSADSPDGCTPIGEGAVQAASMASGGGNPAKHLLLLTDGKNNRGRSVADASNASALNGVTVHTLGLGSGAHIDPVEITTIATDHGGTFRRTESPSEVLDFFAETLGDMLGTVEIAAISGGTATVAPGTSKAVFLIAWDDPTTDHDFDLETPDGTTVDHATIPTLQGINVSYHPSTSDSAHAYFVVDGNISGDWQFRNTPSGVDTIALEDLDLRIQWSARPQFGVTGQPIELEARVTYRGDPYRGDVTVTADVTRPDEAQGDLLAESLRDDPVSVTPKGDTSQRERIVSSVLERTGRDGFRYASTPDLTFDDEGDGVHRLSFTDTDYDGVYRFDLRAEGWDEAGDRVFARRATRFCTLIPDVDGGRTTTEIEQIDGGLYRVGIVPRTSTGEFVGPFLADLLTIQSTRGTAVGELDDEHDGSYTQIVRTDGAEPSDVSVGVRGRTVPVDQPSDDAGDGASDRSDSRLPWLLVVLLLILLGVVVILLL